MTGVMGEGDYVLRPWWGEDAVRWVGRLSKLSFLAPSIRSQALGSNHPHPLDPPSSSSFL